jgi:NAD(P)-dependent dehydrogenase (short-subunit alcohol dehydrogenase family)
VPFLLTGAIAPQMARDNGGAVVNIGSITGLRGASGSVVYSANKAAIHSLTTSWADEYGPAGVRVNAVAPGPIATERQREYADHLAPVLARIPSRRMSTPSEVADAVVFLASPAAANIHGAILNVDGGWSAVYPSDETQERYPGTYGDGHPLLRAARRRMDGFVAK